MKGKAGYITAAIIIALQLLTLQSVRQSARDEESAREETAAKLKEIESVASTAAERTLMIYTASRFTLTALQEIKDGMEKRGYISPRASENLSPQEPGKKGTFDDIPFDN